MYSYTSIRIVFLMSCIYAISESYDTDFASQVDYKPRVLSVSYKALVPITYSHFNTCSRVRVSAASACNWATYRTFYVTVPKCRHYIKCFANWACRCVPAQIRTRLLVQPASSLFTKPRGPAMINISLHRNWNKISRLSKKKFRVQIIWV